MHDMLSTFGSSGPLTCPLPCSELFRRGMVLPSVVVPCCFPSVPLVRKLMQMMQLVMAAFPSVWQEILSKDVLASCLIYAVCLVYWYTLPVFFLLLQYLVPFRSSPSHVKTST